MIFGTDQLWTPSLSPLPHSIDDRGEYHFDFSQVECRGEVPVASFAPALILRKRSARGYLRLLDTIQKYLENGGTVPDGFALISGTGRSPSANSSDGRGNFTETVYFPLPANDDQLEIVPTYGAS